MTIPARALGTFPPAAGVLGWPCTSSCCVWCGIWSLLHASLTVWPVEGGWKCVLALAPLQLSHAHHPPPGRVFTDHGLEYEKCTCVLKVRTVVLKWKIAEGNGQPEFFNFPKCILRVKIIPQSYSET